MTQGLFNVLLIIANLINFALPIVVALALLYFFWGLAQYVLNASNEEKKGKGKEIMIWGIIALFVMVSVWGIVNVVKSTFQLNDQAITVPNLNIQSGSPGQTRP
jgi:hypothetical protein